MNCFERFIKSTIMQIIHLQYTFNWMIKFPTNTSPLNSASIWSAINSAHVCSTRILDLEFRILSVKVLLKSKEFNGKPLLNFARWFIGVNLRNLRNIWIILIFLEVFLFYLFFSDLICFYFNWFLLFLWNILYTKEEPFYYSKNLSIKFNYNLC